MKNKKGWIEVLESFIAILLIAAVVLLVTNKNSSKQEDISGDVYDIELLILREIETNDTLRSSVLSQDDSALPLEWERPNFPEDLKQKINSRIPSYLDCVAKICQMNAPCSLSDKSSKDIYVQSVSITKNIGDESEYRIVNLFCWVS